MDETNTAYLDWDRKWQTPEERSAWSVPEKDVEDLIPFLKEKNVERVLDLGCGVGRHSLLFAREGFEVHALDRSNAGIAFLQREAGAAGLDIRTALSDMTVLPYQNGFFDLVMAWHVIYHGDLSIVTRVISEITRVLNREGFFLGTMISLRSPNRGKRISYNTYISDEESDKSHPHFYSGFRDVCGLLDGYEPWFLRDQEHADRESFHWRILAQKLS
jgi:SAM-dependent methyltransferase